MTGYVALRRFVESVFRPTDATGMSTVGAVTSGMRRSASARSLKAPLIPINQTGKDGDIAPAKHDSLGCVWVCARMHVCLRVYF